MFKLRPKTNSIFQHGDSFSESALSSSDDDDDEDTATFDTSYYSGGSATNTMSNCTEGTDGETNAATYWTADGGSTIGQQGSPCFGNGFFRGPCSRQARTKSSETKSSETKAVSEAGCMNFIWDSSSDEGEQEVKMLKTPSVKGRKLDSSNILSVEARDESSTELQDAFTFLSDERPNGSATALSKVVPKSSGVDTEVPEEHDSTLFTLLVTTGSNLLGLDDRSSDSSDGSRLRRVTSEARRPIEINTKPEIARKDPPSPRTFKAPWNRTRRRQDEPKHDRRDDVEHSKLACRPKMRYTSNPFSGRLSRQKNISSTSKAINPINATKSAVASVPRSPQKLVRQPETDKRLNDAITVFEANGAPLLSTLSRAQSSRFIPSRELQQQMEYKSGRHNFDFEDSTIPDAPKPLPAVSEQNRSKSQSRAQRPALECGLPRRTSKFQSRERQELKGATNRSVKTSSNRSMSTRSKGHSTSKSRHTRSSRRTRTTSRATSQAASRKSQTMTSTNQLSFSDDEGYDFFSIGSLDA